MLGRWKQGMAGAGLCLLGLAVPAAIGISLFGGASEPQMPRPVEQIAGASSLHNRLIGALPATHASNHRQLESHFDTLGYTLTAVRQGEEVPRLFLHTIPQDLPELADYRQRKTAFIQIMLPLILAENEKILNDRRRLVALHARYAAKGQLQPDQQTWLRELADYYRLADFSAGREEDWRRLLRRVDVIPASLALAQGAIESGWGTSRFAQQGNAIFGQWSWKPGSGMVPEGRPEGAQYEIRAFQRLSISVRSYLRNLNTHRAYAALRQNRVQMRAEGTEPRGWALAGHLESYSQRGVDYIAELRKIIRINRLDKLDKAILRAAGQSDYPTTLSML
ncbi:MAG TPA: hypothetical protein DCO73_10200 [Alphaproteobacteria bacterium]|nr:hypothetical protein [Alphaproteobacteria bacterium]